MVEDVLNKELQAKLTPDDIIEDFKAGNKRYLNNKLRSRDFKTQIKNSAETQYPKAIVLSCVDSRVPVEYILDQGIGSIFVTRIAGNFANEDILGSMEFACKLAGAKVIMVMGHESCGAINAAIDNIKVGKVKAIIEKIKPAMDMALDYKGEKKSSNSEYVNLVCKNNIINTIKNIRSLSTILKELEDKDEIKIIGAIYWLSNGMVEFFD